MNFSAGTVQYLDLVMLKWPSCIGSNAQELTEKVWFALYVEELQSDGFETEQKKDVT